MPKKHLKDYFVKRRHHMTKSSFTYFLGHFISPPVSNVFIIRALDLKPFEIEIFDLAIGIVPVLIALHPNLCSFMIVSPTALRRRGPQICISTG